MIELRVFGLEKTAHVGLGKFETICIEAHVKEERLEYYAIIEPSQNPMTIFI